MANGYSRRRFIRDTSLGSLALAPLLSSFSCLSAKDRLGVALVGLGSYSRHQLGPALKRTKNCYLAGIVTGTPSKIPYWTDTFGLKEQNVFNYENFDTVAGNPDIDIIYVVLPVSMHKEFTIRGAKAGKHVICEKPMAVNARDCQEMIDACKKADKMLSIGYRLHFEPYNQEMMRLGQKKVYGKLIELDCQNGFRYEGDPESWRLKKAMSGGGGLMDMGVYAIQGARYTTGEEPIFVTAKEEKTRPELFREVDETIHFTLEFPSGAIAKCVSSYNMHLNHLYAKAEQGKFGLAEAYRYEGMVGKTPAGKMDFPQINQQAAQMDDFAACVMNRKPTRVPGEMGLADIRVTDAIYRSLASGKREKI